MEYLLVCYCDGISAHMLLLSKIFCLPLPTLTCGNFHETFENPHSLEIRAVFLDISKAFDKVWHEGLIFKLKRNGISGSLLNLFENYHQNRK